uniref:Uncharacterized protein n=1 Tax=Glossina brevipalpis TaxID=37001 RepID=A0A1A9WYM7_9MUSC
MRKASALNKALEFGQDIFNEQLMPAKFFDDELLLLNNSDLLFNLKNSHQHVNLPEYNASDLITATKTMNYHRRMMNKYLLSTYLAQQIADTIHDRLPKIQRFEVVQKRLGTATNLSDPQPTTTTTTTTNDNKQSNTNYSNHKRLKDQGSSEYLSWLHKIKILKDIQKQLQHKQTAGESTTESINVTSNRRNLLTNDYESKADDNDDDDYDFEDVEEGDITGYAFINEALNSSNNPQQYPYKNKDDRSDFYTQSISKAGYDRALHNGRSSSNPLPYQQFEAPSSLTKQNSEIRLKDVTDIALTTLAFLSFGMFILHVLMCITMTKDDTSTPMMAMEGVDNDDGIEEIRRKRRSPLLFESEQKMQILNNLARRFLRSIDAAIFLRKDHFNMLCENNKLAIQEPNLLKLWIPMWR